MIDELGEALIPDALTFAERSRVLPVRLKDGTMADLLLATLPFEIDAIGRAVTVPFEGIKIRVVRPEDFIIYKSISTRPRDLLDIVGVLQRQDDLDVEGLEKDIQAWSIALEDETVMVRWHEARKEAGR